MSYTDFSIESVAKGLGLRILTVEIFPNLETSAGVALVEGHARTWDESIPGQREGQERVHRGPDPAGLP